MSCNYQFVFLISANYVLDTMLSQVEGIQKTRKIGIDPAGDFDIEMGRILSAVPRGTGKICFVIIGPYWKRFQTRLTDYLREMYSGCVLVCYLGDLFRVLGHAYGVSLLQFKNDFDFIISYDRSESAELDFLYRRPPFDFLPMKRMENKWDFCFVGGNKNRLDLLHFLSEKAKKRGYSCRFLVIGVPTGKRIPDDQIEYLDAPIDFAEVLRIASQSRCIVDFIQDGAYSIDIRFIESLFFEKHYLSNCKEMLECEEYYDFSKYSHIFEPDMELDFVREPITDREIQKKAIAFFSSETFVEDISILLEDGIKGYEKWIH